MRYFTILDYGNQAPAPPPLVTAGLPLVDRRFAQLNYAAPKTSQFNYGDGSEFWQRIIECCQQARAQRCEIVIYMPIACVKEDRETELSVACELAIRGYFSVLKATACASNWMATPGPALHAYGHKVSRLDPLNPTAADIALSPILAFAADVWLRLEKPTLELPFGQWPLGWFSGQPERFALAGW